MRVRTRCHHEIVFELWLVDVCLLQSLGEAPRIRAGTVAGHPTPCLLTMLYYLNGLGSSRSAGAWILSPRVHLLEIPVAYTSTRSPSGHLKLQLGSAKSSSPSEENPDL